MSGALAGLLRRRWGLPPEAEALIEGLEQSWAEGHSGLELNPADLALLAKCPAVAHDLDAEVRPLVLNGSTLQSRRHAQAERETAQRFKVLAAQALPAVPDKLLQLWKRVYPDPKDPQALAVRQGLEHSLLLITGGPGTGKTHCAARLLGLALEAKPDLRYALAAPTGKAAQRLGESMAQASTDPSLGAALPQGSALLAQASTRAKTLHRLLEWRGNEGRCLRDQDRPLDLDLLIVDEAGMVDLLLWRALLRALAPGCRLVLLGDPYQLESVGLGRVLGDLVEAARDPKQNLALAELKRNYRFEARPGIGALAEAARLRDGAAFLAAAPKGAAKNAEVQRWDASGSGLDAALDKVWPQVLELANAASAEEALKALRSLRLLCAHNEGSWGAAGMQERIAGRLAAAGLARASHPVLVTANDPHLGLFNGDLGVLMDTDAGRQAVFPGPQGPRTFAVARLPEWRAAWAMTVHRSQGSEFDTVLLVLPAKPTEWLGPELLYTAVTRAREQVLLVASDTALLAACAPRTTRRTGLGAWLKKTE